MPTISEKRRRRSMMTSVALFVLAAIIFTPRFDEIELPDFGVPLVSAAIAAEAE